MKSTRNVAHFLDQSFLILSFIYNPSHCISYVIQLVCNNLYNVLGRDGNMEGRWTTHFIMPRAF